MAKRVVLCVQNLSVPRDPRVWREARDLAAAGYDVSVVCPRSPGLARREVLQGVEILRHPAPRERPGLVGQLVETAAALFWTTLLVLRLQCRGRIEVLHVANPPDTFFLVGLVLRPFGTRFVFDQHDAVPELLTVQLGNRRFRLVVMRVLERLSYALADLVISTNESYRHLALTRGKKRGDSVVVVRSGPDEVRAIPRVPPTQPPAVVFAGSIGVQDGVEFLLDAAAQLLERRPGLFRVEIFGTGDAVPALQRRAERLGIAPAITWAGWVERDELLDRLASAAVAVSPDDDNSFTRISTMLKVTDYLGVGLPAVVADLPENRVTAGDAVSYFRPGDVDSLAKQIEELLDEPVLADDLAARARRRAQDLVWDHSRVHLLAAYDRLIGPP